MSKRVFLIVLDSFGIGAEPDAAAFGDEGTNTLAAVAQSPALRVPTMGGLGLFNIEGVNCGKKSAAPVGAFARLQEASNGKDTTIGHWEIAGLESPRALPTYPEGFPPEVIAEFEEKTGRKVLCNKPYSGTEVLKDYGEEHLRTGALIVYTSADSVFQVAAHEDVVPVEELYRYCEAARAMLLQLAGQAVLLRGRDELLGLFGLFCLVVLKYGAEHQHRVFQAAHQVAQGRHVRFAHGGGLHQGHLHDAPVAEQGDGARRGHRRADVRRGALHHRHLGPGVLQQARHRALGHAPGQVFVGGVIIIHAAALRLRQDLFQLCVT